jgi:hypothetical protein
VLGLIPSPITGPAGNHEFLLWLSGQIIQPPLETTAAIENCLAMLDTSSE